MSVAFGLRLAWGLALVIAAFRFGHLFDPPAEQCSKRTIVKAISVVACCMGILLLLRAFNVIGPEEKASLPFLNDLEAAEKLAKEQQRPLLIDFRADWCKSCRKLESEVFSNKEVAEALKPFVLVQIDLTQEQEQTSLWQKRENVLGLPSVIFKEASGKEIAQVRLNEFEGPKAFLKRIDYAVSGRQDPFEPEDALFSQMGASLQAGGIEVYLLVFLAGIIASLSPCVYPMIPITLRVLTGKMQAPERKRSQKTKKPSAKIEDHSVAAAEDLQKSGDPLQKTEENPKKSGDLSENKTEASAKNGQGASSTKQSLQQKAENHSGFYMSLLRSLLFVLGLALTYSTLGVIAASTGGLFGSLLQSPVVVLFVAAIFLAMGASMLGAFTLRWPQGIQNRLGHISSKKTNAFFAPILTGLMAGLVAAPCVGPPLIAVLAYVAQSGNRFQGFFLLLTYALGMGLLFFVLGCASGLLKRMPRSGKWMNAVKGTLGLAVMTVGLLYIETLYPFVP